MSRAQTQADAQPVIDWQSLTDEAARLLSEYIRVDTTNPPGNERLACEWLGELLDAEGIEHRLYDPGGGRTSLVATLASDGSRGKALVLLNHTDVVPVEAAHWSVPPFDGAIRDGYVWGRGALDMKGLGILELLVLLLHRRMELPLRRDLTFMAVADEEAGGHCGVEFLDREHPKLLDCDFVINEGGSGSTELFGTERTVFQVGVAEKGPLWIRLRATGSPGHGSVPHDDNALERLTRALTRVLDWERPTELTPPVQQYFEQLHMAGVLPARPDAQLLAALAAEHPRVASLQTNSVSLTGVSSGVKHNVIPAEATATLDVRLVPGYDAKAFIGELEAVIDDPAIQLDVVFESSTEASPIDTELYVAIEAAVHEAIEDAAVVPSVSTGFTDSRVFRRRGIPAYGFSPMLLRPDDAGRAHGNDERVSVENLGLGLQILFSTVRRICG